MFNPADVGRRLALCADALKIRERIAAAPASAQRATRILCGTRLAAIRKALRGRSADLSDVLLSPSGGMAALRELLEAARGGTDYERFEVAARAQAIHGLMRVFQAAESRVGIQSELDDAELLKICAEWIGDADPLVNAQIERGAFAEEFKARAKSAAEQPEAFSVQVDPELQATNDAIAARLMEMRLAVRDQYGPLVGTNLELWARYARDAQQGDEWAREFCAGVLAEAEGQEWGALFAEYRRIVLEEKIPAEDAIQARRGSAVAEARALRVEVGRQAINDLLAASLIAEDAATAWANAQEITPTAIARLKKIGYPADQVRKDMAEFYRLTGGRLMSIRVHSRGDRRANATNIYSLEEVGTINLDGDFDKKTLWHELGHHIEADPVAKLAAGRLIRRRAENGGRSYTLRSLTGNKAYRSDEVAYKDGFFSPYVGKVYQDGTTEVFSMGVESFSDPERLAKRMAQDPETLEFVAGFLKAPPSPMLKALLALRETLRGAVEQDKEQAGASVDALIEQLAAGVSIRQTNDDSALPEWVRYSVQRHGYKLVGMFSEGAQSTLLLSGWVRNWDTKRRAAGLILALAGTNESGRVFFQVLDTYPGRNVDLAKAAYAIYTRRGTAPNQHQMQSESFLSEYAK
ncbi:hypothetical protein [Uliginosibacterium sediminicola]|uniref:Uncharacterized protein n=1 Tax=Uliginosibacterium sediminicola TaxID=2024550 RepID=A0ABU9YWI6_9RHOO